MTAVRAIAALLLVLTGLTGCAGTDMAGFRGQGPAPPPPLMASPSQIFDDVPQGP